jgi:hypothetical protein
MMGSLIGLVFSILFLCLLYYYPVYVEKHKWPTKARYIGATIGCVIWGILLNIAIMLVY